METNGFRDLSLSDRLKKSIELAKAGFENAQARISFVDSKVGVAVGLLAFLIPGQIAVVGWFISEGSDDTKNGFAKHFLETCPKCLFSTTMIGLGLLGGLAVACVALGFGIACLSPRGPKGYGKSGPFHNQWQPNVLFPIYTPDRNQTASEHFRKLESGVDDAFVLAEYKHQLEQLGRILHEKFNAMNACFRCLRFVLALYAFAVVFALKIGWEAIR